MAGTAMYKCGCSITSSMFGEREIIDIQVCAKHKQHRKIKRLLQKYQKVKHRLASELVNVFMKEGE